MEQSRLDGPIGSRDAERGKCSGKSQPSSDGFIPAGTMENSGCRALFHCGSLCFLSMTRPSGMGGVCIPGHSTEMTWNREKEEGAEVPS